MIALRRKGKPVTIGEIPPRVRSRELPPDLPHDPMPSCYLPTVLNELAMRAPAGSEKAYERAACFMCTHSGYGPKAESSDQIFVRAPRVRYRRCYGGPVKCYLTWVYDGHELTLWFEETGITLDGRRVSDEQAVAAVIAWNDHVLRGEGRRIRLQREATLACVPAADDEDYDDE